MQEFSVLNDEFGRFIFVGPTVLVNSFFQYEGGRALSILSRLGGLYYFHGTIGHSNVGPDVASAGGLGVRRFVVRMRFVRYNGFRFSADEEFRVAYSYECSFQMRM